MSDIGLNILIAVNIIWLIGNMYYDFFVNSRHNFNFKLYKKAFELLLDRAVESCVMDKLEADAIKYRVSKLSK